VCCIKFGGMWLRRNRLDENGLLHQMGTESGGEGEIDMKTMFMAAAGLMAAVSVAQAAGLPLKAPIAPVDPHNWTAFYIGGFIGGTWADGNFCPSPGATLLGSCNDFKVNGVVGGGYIGADYELPNRIVLGARLSAPVGSITGTQSAPLGFGPPGTTISAKFKYALIGTGTVGYDFGPWMPFIGAGVALANVDATVTTPFVSGSASQTQTGVNFLTGLKFAYTRNWAFGIQYNHMEFERVTYNFSGLAVSSFPVRLHEDSLIGTIDYRF
jgi:outer membrane immunogenic protein